MPPCLMSQRSWPDRAPRTPCLLGAPLAWSAQRSSGCCRDRPASAGRSHPTTLPQAPAQRDGIARAGALKAPGARRTATISHDETAHGVCREPSRRHRLLRGAGARRAGGGVTVEVAEPPPAAEGVGCLQPAPILGEAPPPARGLERRRDLGVVGVQRLLADAIAGMLLIEPLLALSLAVAPGELLQVVSSCGGRRRTARRRCPGPAGTSCVAGCHRTTRAWRRTPPRSGRAGSPARDRRARPGRPSSAAAPRRSGHHRGTCPARPTSPARGATRRPAARRSARSRADRGGAARAGSRSHSA